jgi:hypothetical protein
LGASCPRGYRKTSEGRTPHGRAEGPEVARKPQGGTAPSAALQQRPARSEDRSPKVHGRLLDGPQARLHAQPRKPPRAGRGHADHYRVADRPLARDGRDGPSRRSRPPRPAFAARAGPAPGDPRGREHEASASSKPRRNRAGIRIRVRSAALTSLAAPLRRRVTGLPLLPRRRALVPGGGGACLPGYA